MQTVGKASIKAYRAAIVDLWNPQTTLGLSEEKHPVQGGVKAVLETHSRTDERRRKERYEDRGAGTSFDGYNDNDLRRLINFCWTGWVHSRKRQSVEPHLRTAVTC